MRQGPSHIVWWRSLYLRIGANFVLFVLGITFAQGLLWVSMSRRQAHDLRSSPNAAAMHMALGLSEQLQRGERLDLPGLHRERYPEWPNVYVVTRSDVRASGAVALDPEVVKTARLMMDPTITADQLDARPHGPVVMAPLRFNNTLHGLVVIPPPGGNIFVGLMKFVSPHGVFLLLTATTLAAFVIFGPARRKLAGLEAAAERMRQGDLQARAPEDGGDEIALVARAFNRMGDELAHRDEQLRRVDALRRQMLADVGHELRTPLTAMRGFVETLQMPGVADDPQRRQRYFATITRETTRLERIVSDLLDVARLEGGVAEFEFRLFDVQRLFEQVARRHEQAAHAQGIKLGIDVDVDADQVMGDPHRLEQAIENLVANAIRHSTTGGRVVMQAAIVEGRVRLSVRDTGPGIPADHLAHVFDRFYKADPSRAATVEGSGLGLSIVKAIVERHGGQVSVSSQPGDTCFTILLPADASA